MVDFCPLPTEPLVTATGVSLLPHLGFWARDTTCPNAQPVPGSGESTGLTLGVLLLLLLSLHLLLLFKKALFNFLNFRWDFFFFLINFSLWGRCRFAGRLQHESWGSHTPPSPLSGGSSLEHGHLSPRDA